MADAPLLVEIEGGVARLTLNRPDAGNAIDLPMARALHDAAIACEEDPRVRCVLLTGAGRFFCTGGDIAYFADSGDALPANLKHITAALHGAVVRLSRMAKPLVTAVNGPAAGAGLPLAILGDIAIAAADAHFTSAYTGVGMSPDGGTTWLLPRLIGLRRAQELLITNRRVSAEEAVAIGLVTRVAAPDALAGEAQALAGTLAAGATAAIGATRRLLLTATDSGLETQLEAESRSIADQGRTRDGREGIAAFLARRRPSFTGD